jgi:predicted acetyltransferase
MDANAPPAPPLTVLRAAAQERPLLARMLELYQHDLSDIWDQDLDAHGEFGYDLDRFWRDPACAPYVFRAGGQPAGFALVDARVRLPGGDLWMDQFFVMRKYRGRGVGRDAALAVFRAHPGRWQVGQMPANVAAQRFWRRTIGLFTGGDYTEVTVTSGGWQGVVQCFESRGGAGTPPASHHSAAP